MVEESGRGERPRVQRTWFGLFGDSVDVGQQDVVRLDWRRRSLLAPQGRDVPYFATRMEGYFAAGHDLTRRPLDAQPSLHA